MAAPVKRMRSYNTYLKMAVFNSIGLLYWTAEVREEIAQDVLRRVCQLMLTIRGFSIAAMYMEEYKQSQKKTTGKAVGLRKELKQQTILS